MTPARQILVTGCYRSGTEYASQLLGNHPRLAMSMYVVSYLRFCHGRYDPADPADLARLLFDASWRIRSRWGLRLDAHALLDELAAGPVDHARVYDAVMRSLFLGPDHAAWGEKTQLVWTRIPAFLDMFPQGRAVLVVRDPRAVLASFKACTNAPPPAYLGAVFNAHGAMLAGLEYRRSHPDRFCMVRFEDLLARPEPILEELFDFLGHPPEHDLLSTEGWTDARGEPWGHNSAFLPPDAPGASFDPTAAMRRWQGNLGPAEMGLCQAVCAETMDALGYAPEPVDAAWGDMVRPLLADAALTAHLRRWLDTGRGVEAFPSDPLRPENWEENAAPDARE